MDPIFRVKCRGLREWNSGQRSPKPGIFTTQSGKIRSSLLRLSPFKGFIFINLNIWKVIRRSLSVPDGFPSNVIWDPLRSFGAPCQSIWKVFRHFFYSWDFLFCLVSCLDTFGLMLDQDSGPSWAERRRRKARREKFTCGNFTLPTIHLGLAGLGPVFVNLFITSFFYSFIHLEQVVTKFLEGKNKPVYHPLNDTGDHVVIINSKEVKFNFVCKARHKLFT